MFKGSAPPVTVGRCVALSLPNPPSYASHQFSMTCCSSTITSSAHPPHAHQDPTNLARQPLVRALPPPLAPQPAGSSGSSAHPRFHDFGDPRLPFSPSCYVARHSHGALPRHHIVRRHGPPGTGQPLLHVERLPLEPPCRIELSPPDRHEGERRARFKLGS